MLPDSGAAHALEGGVLIGLSVTALLLLDGRVAGISGILGGLIGPVTGDVSWRVLFLVGLVLAGIVARVAFPGSFGALPTRSVPVLALAGCLVGLGTRMAGGCTSGHGVCGTSRLAPRSIVATLTFMGMAASVVFLVRHAP